jgi:hypothetical protein
VPQFFCLSQADQGPATCYINSLAQLSSGNKPRMADPHPNKTQDSPSTPPYHPNTEKRNTPQSTRRESHRLRTPVVRPGYVQTRNDSCLALTSDTTQLTHVAARRKAKENSTSEDFNEETLDSTTSMLASDCEQNRVCFFFTSL